MIIVGLGNPGKEYAKTPHNVRFMAVDMIAEYYNIKFMLSQKHQAMIGEGIIEGEKCPECGADIVHENGCNSCKSCGYSKCG